MADHPAIQLLDLFGLQSVAVLRFEIPSHSVGDKLSQLHTGHLLKAVGVAGDSTATVHTIDLKILDVEEKEGQKAVAKAYAAGEGADMKVHLAEVGKTDPKVILAKLAQMPEADQDAFIRAFIEGNFRYLALNEAVEKGGDLSDKHAHIDMRSYRFTSDADYPHGQIMFVLECSRSNTVKICGVGELVTHYGWTGAKYHEYKTGKVLLKLKVSSSAGAGYPNSDTSMYSVRNIVNCRGEAVLNDDEGDNGSDDDTKKPGIALVYTHNQVVPENIATDVLQNESAQNVFYGLGDEVTPEQDGHLTALSHKVQKVVANQILPTYGKLRAATGIGIDVAKLSGDGLRVQAKLLAAMSADEELMHAGMLVELVPRELYFERHPFGTAPFVSLESFQTRSFAFVAGMLDGMPELEFPKWDKKAHGSKAAPTIKKQFNDLASIPNGPWHRRVVGKLREMFPNATTEDSVGTDGNAAMWNQGLIRMKHRVANYPKGYKFKERVIVPLAAIVRGNSMHEVGTEPSQITDFVNKPLQYVHFDAPKPAQDGSIDYYGLNTQEGLAKIARMRRDWPLKHMLAVPQIEEIVKEVALASGNSKPSRSDLMLIFAKDMLKEIQEQQIFNRLFVREAMNIWTDVTPHEALTHDYLIACHAYSSNEEMKAALAKTNGNINPGNRLAIMDAHTLSDLDYPAERTDLIMKNPRFIDLAGEAKIAFAEDPKFQAIHADVDMELLKVADTAGNPEAKKAQMGIKFQPDYPKLPQYPSSVLNKALPTHRWYMAEESKAGDGFLMYLDESPHTATFENGTHPRLSVETRMLIVDVLDKDCLRKDFF